MEPQPPIEAVRSAAIEQIMRATSDDTVVLPFLSVEPASDAAHAALGRLLLEVPVRLRADCPLVVLVAGGTLDPAWRSYHPAEPDSLWSALEFMEAVYGTSGGNPYERLEKVRSLSEADIPSFGGTSL